MSQIPPQPDHSEIAAAIERRVQAEREKAQADAALKAQREFEQLRDKRQEFRRLIDPGILRPNARELAIEALIVACFHGGGMAVVAPADMCIWITHHGRLSRHWRRTYWHILAKTSTRGSSRRIRRLRRYSSTRREHWSTLWRSVSILIVS